MWPQNYKAEDDKKLRLYVMVAETSLAKLIYEALEDNADQIDQLGIDFIL